MLVKQTDFGIRPSAAAGGLVKVEDEVTVTLRIVARVRGNAAQGGRRSRSDEPWNKKGWASVEMHAVVNSQRETMRIAILLVSFAFVACGGSSSSGGPPTEAPINLTSSGLSSAAVTIPSGGRIHFFNKDTIDHQIASSCSDLASPRLSPGSDSLRPQMTGPQSCTISDALTSAAPFNGTVTVSAPGMDGGSGY